MAKSYVIIPAYNEGPNLGTVLHDLQQLASTMTLAVIVVDDGSRDNTRRKPSASATGWTFKSSPTP